MQPSLPIVVMTGAPPARWPIHMLYGHPAEMHILAKPMTQEMLLDTMQRSARVACARVLVARVPGRKFVYIARAIRRDTQDGLDRKGGSRFAAAPLRNALRAPDPRERAPTPLRKRGALSPRRLRVFSYL